MCDFGLVMSVAGMGLQAMNAYNQSENAKAAYEYQAAVQRNNAMLAEWQAQDEIRRGQDEELAVRRRTAQLKGSQRASLAARGLDISDGSALNLLTDTDYMGEVDALTVRDNAAKKVYATRQQAAGFTAEAGMMKFRADSENPMMAAGTSLLSNAGAVADRWYSYRNRTTDSNTDNDGFWG